MVGHDDLWHGGHSDSVTAQDPVHPVFCGRLKGRALHTHIDAVFYTYLLLTGNLRGKLDQFLVVCLVHIGEARTCGEVLAAQRVLGEEVDVVGDDHQVAHMESLVHAACGVADKEGLDAQFVHHAYGEGDILHRVAFVEVEPALHGEDVHPAEFAENQLAAVTFDGGYGEVGNLRVGELRLVSYF